MLDPVLFLGFFCVVPIVDRTNEVPCDPPDPFKGDRGKFVAQVREVTVDFDVEAFQFSVVFALDVIDISALFIGLRVARNVNIHLSDHLFAEYGYTAMLMFLLYHVLYFVHNN